MNESTIWRTRAAAIVAEYLGSKRVIPIRYRTFPVLTGTSAELRNYLNGKPIEVIEMAPGETLD